MYRVSESITMIWHIQWSFNEKLSYLHNTLCIVLTKYRKYVIYTITITMCKLYEYIMHKKCICSK